MGVYMGYIEKRETEYSTFYNFRPIAELIESNIVRLSTEDQKHLLPDSELLNINFSYSMGNDDDQKWMASKFIDNSLMIFEFTLDDLDANFRPTGERNKTGYKVQARTFWDMGKIRPIDQDRIYYVLKDEDLQSDFNNDKIVDIEAPFVFDDSYVYVQQKDFLAGPYQVHFRTLTSSYYIKPEIEENKYTLSGYFSKDVDIIELDNSDDSKKDIPTMYWRIFTPKENASEYQKDVINDQELLDSFRESIPDDDIEDGMIKLDNIQNLLDHYNNSEFSGSILEDEICQSRLEKIYSILTSGENINDTLRGVTDFICDLLIKNKDDQKVNEWLNELIDHNPELINQLKDVQAISDRIDIMQQDLDDLDAKKAELEEASKKSDHIYEEAIAQKEQEVREMDEEYQNAQQRLNEITERLQMGDNLDELKEKYDGLQHDVSELDEHKKRLEKETSELELEFQQLINSQKEKMTDIAFDGFMSSKMLNAASEWEESESSKQHEELVCAINNVDTPHMDSDELLDYLYSTIQIFRPTYTKNTIINIMTCISQGFLTVFSGEPGCGKTSICNIIGEVLGLNKIPGEIEAPDNLQADFNRYVPVSVEKGWTSKRDFIGYYNPLSKTFDESNKRVYEALRQLDTEKQKGLAKFPYIILLDESNLSPMEYYWSDFMNICDELGPKSNVNLGENYMFGIPETLRFVATINNDHTTETLSPRLIDRAWIISLPKQRGATITRQSYKEDQIKIIDWQSIKDTFIPSEETYKFTAEIQKIYDSILSCLKKERIAVSQRTDNAIKKYWTITSKRFEEDEMGTSASIIALDYALVQKILPKIDGNGENFKEWLSEFKGLCSKNGLNMSAEKLNEIIERGNQQMYYYNFFV